MSRAEGGDWRLRAFDVLASTSDLCRELAAAGEPDGLAVMAGRQIRGRGSRGREWDSPAGNLYLSALLRPGESPRRAGEWALLAGVALREALAELAGPPAARLRLKWPNDLLLDGRKLAGILIDSSADAAGRLAWLVIGIGANLAHAPAVAGRATACLAEVAPPPGPDVAAGRLLARLGHWRRIRQAEGFRPVRDAWLAHGPSPGEPMTLRLPGRLVEGRFGGLGEDGSLLLGAQGAVQAFTTGDVLMPGAAAAREGKASCCW